MLSQRIRDRILEIIRPQRIGESNAHFIDIGHDCIGHNYVGHDYVGHYFIGHNYTGQIYIGHSARQA